MDDFAPLSKDVAELLVQMYQTVPHIAILDLTKQVTHSFMVSFKSAEASMFK